MSLVLGMIFSDWSEDSDLKSCIPPIFRNGRRMMAKAMIPIPPIHWMMARQKRMPREISSRPLRMVDPVVVTPETDSKMASVKDMPRSLI